MLPESPAARANLHPGDRILNISGHQTAFMLSQAEVETLLVGRDGETIELTVQRRSAPAPTNVPLVLSGLPKSAVEAHLVTSAGRKYAHVRVHAFRSGTAEALKRTLKDLHRASGDGPAGIILDVRGNPGGEVSEAVMIADMFLSEGVVVRTRGRGGQILREERARPAGSDTTLPLVVLQDRRSASASELLAIALQDHGRARIVGERSFGKGTVQEIIGLGDGSQLTLTIARYFSPKDHLIDGHGVTPDVPVVLDPLGSPGEDQGLAAALAALAHPNVAG